MARLMVDEMMSSVMVQSNGPVSVKSVFGHFANSSGRVEAFVHGSVHSDVADDSQWNVKGGCEGGQAHQKGT